MATSLRESLPTRLVVAVRLFLVAVAVASMVLGYIGLDALVHLPFTQSRVMLNPAASNLVYNDFELFLGQSQPAAQAPSLPWQLQIARFAAPTVALYAIAEGGVALFATGFRRSRLRGRRGHAVVCGTTRAAEALATRLREDGMRVVVVANDVAGWPERDTSVADPRTATGLATAGVALAERLYACLERGEDNAQIAAVAERMRSAARRPERIHALIPDLELCTALRARRLSLAGSTGRHLGFFNPDELAAHAVVRADEGATASGLDGEAPHLAIVGSGPFARSILVEAARQWLGRGGARKQPLDVILIDAAADRVAEQLMERYAFLDHSCRIEARTEPFETVLAQRTETAGLGPLRRLYLCQENESEALKAALDAAVRFQSAFVEVVVRLDRMAAMASGFGPNGPNGPRSADGAGRGAHVSTPAWRASIAGAGASGAKAGTPGALVPQGAVFDALGGRLRLVDVTEHGCDPRVIDEDLAEWLARSCHLHYLATGLAAGAELGSSAAMVPWESLSNDYREANRDQVSDIGRKLAAIGCVVSPRRRDVTPFAYSRDEVERLAVLEHERWVSEHRRHGWKLGDDRDEAARTHPAMVDWADLPAHEREKDREAVRQIPGILADAGLSVIRVGPPAARSR